MSDEIESIFDSVFGKGGPFEAIFGRGGKLDEALRKGPKVVRHSIKRDERARYQEALVTELLITLAGKGLLTNTEAQDVIRRAKERSSKRDEATAEQKPPRDVPCGGSCGGLCPLHDTRPHKKLECQRCKKVMSHLIEGEVARCRVCLTPRLSS